MAAASGAVAARRATSLPTGGQPLLSSATATPTEATQLRTEVILTAGDAGTIASSAFASEKGSDAPPSGMFNSPSTVAFSPVFELELGGSCAEGTPQPSRTTTRHSLPVVREPPATTGKELTKQAQGQQHTSSRVAQPAIPAGALDRSQSDLQVLLVHHGGIRAGAGAGVPEQLTPTGQRLMELLSPQTPLEEELARHLRSFRSSRIVQPKPAGLPSSGPGTSAAPTPPASAAAPPGAGATHAAPAALSPTDAAGPGSTLAAAISGPTPGEVEVLAAQLMAAGFLVQIRDGTRHSKDARACLRTLKHRFLVCLGWQPTGPMCGAGPAPWGAGPGGAGRVGPGLGPEPLRQLEPQHLTEPLVVEVRFREQFLIANPSRDYGLLLMALPIAFVGSLRRLDAAVTLIADEVAAVFRASGRSLPPWRTKGAMLSKWAPDQLVELQRLLQHSRREGDAHHATGALPWDVPVTSPRPISCNIHFTPSATAPLTPPPTTSTAPSTSTATPSAALPALGAPGHGCPPVMEVDMLCGQEYQQGATRGSGAPAHWLAPPGYSISGFADSISVAAAATAAAAAAAACAAGGAAGAQATRVAPSPFLSAEGHTFGGSPVRQMLHEQLRGAGADAVGGSSGAVQQAVCPVTEPRGGSGGLGGLGEEMDGLVARSNSEPALARGTSGGLGCASSGSLCSSAQDARQQPLLQPGGAWGGRYRGSSGDGTAIGLVQSAGSGGCGVEQAVEAADDDGGAGEEAAGAQRQAGRQAAGAADSLVRGVAGCALTDGLTGGAAAAAAAAWGLPARQGDSLAEESPLASCFTPLVRGPPGSQPPTPAATPDAGGSDSPCQGDAPCSGCGLTFPVLPPPAFLHAGGLLAPQHQPLPSVPEHPELQPAPPAFASHAHARVRSPFATVSMPEEVGSSSEDAGPRNLFDAFASSGAAAAAAADPRVTVSATGMARRAASPFASISSGPTYGSPHDQHALPEFTLMPTGILSSVPHAGFAPIPCPADSRRAATATLPMATPTGRQPLHDLASQQAPCAHQQAHHHQQHHQHHQQHHQHHHQHQLHLPHGGYAAGNPLHDFTNRPLAAGALPEAGAGDVAVRGSGAAAAAAAAATAAASAAAAAAAGGPPVGPGLVYSRSRSDVSHARREHDDLVEHQQLHQQKQQGHAQGRPGAATVPGAVGAVHVAPALQDHHHLRITRRSSSDLSRAASKFKNAKSMLAAALKCAASNLSPASSNSSANTPSPGASSGAGGEADGAAGDKAGRRQGVPAAPSAAPPGAQRGEGGAAGRGGGGGGGGGAAGGRTCGAATADAEGHPVVALQGGVVLLPAANEPAWARINKVKWSQAPPAQAAGNAGN